MGMFFCCLYILESHDFNRFAITSKLKDDDEIVTCFAREIFENFGMVFASKRSSKIEIRVELQGTFFRSFFVGRLRHFDQAFSCLSLLVSFSRPPRPFDLIFLLVSCKRLLGRLFW